MYFCENSDFEIYTDLACERRRADESLPDVNYRRERCSVGTWEKIEITGEAGAASIGRPVGFYDTLLLDRFDLLDGASTEISKDELAHELISMLEKIKCDVKRLLIVGLGNASLTPDALGAQTASLIKPTLHIKSIDENTFRSLGCAEIAVIKPGVGSESGLDAKDTVKGICDRIHPDAVIAIDALAARAPERLGTTIQLSSTGIIPGGGLGSPRGAISIDTIGVPVISIGVPTVMDARFFLCDDLKRTEGRSAMFVSPKEINEIVDVGADIIADGINRAFGIG